ncbi:FAD/NAD(P)-binding protein [Sinorhizobium sp. BG8]|uniref:FAD/NAD(P)-binding protein n=1 Tax=Sinorhizobium sp. BG8 TaxID=2613773 RepID=UPI00193DE85F|nr:FAD/NAD(P)-binding protein [Sinorhizobium sp. BG8]QRM57594.1 FAD-dependent oxidoreductase [Sinorhizobium sp. BG8]
MTAEVRDPTIVVVGGGFTGAALAYHLVRHHGAAAQIVVFEPRQSLGAGLAYDTDEDVHRINVPAARMTLVPGDDEHFLRWLHETRSVEQDPGSLTPTGHVFPRRSVFGRYVASQLEPLIREGRVQHRQTRALSVERQQNSRWLVCGEDGQTLEADIVVLATSHPKPQAPAGMDRALSGHPRCVPDPTASRALAAIRPHDRVLVVGAGLTSADVIATLAAGGHEGEILAVSRRGLRSRGHNLDVQEPFGDFMDPPVRTTLQLLRRVRAAVFEAANEGVTWHAVFDRLRAQGGEIWRSLPVVERRRLVKFLRPYWDVHRFRIAPQIESVIEAKIAAGRLRFQAASIAGIERSADDTVVVRLRQRHRGQIREERFDSVVVTTGPGHGKILESQPLLVRLAEDGFIKADPVGLGIAVDDDSRPTGRDGGPVNGLYVAGPLARGTFGELMGLPQVTEHACFVADRVADDLRLDIEEAEAGERRRAI